MVVGRFRKKPVVVEALQWTGENIEELRAFIPKKLLRGTKIVTLEGVMTISRGDWIIKGVLGEYYPCKPDVFEKTYDEDFLSE